MPIYKYKCQKCNSIFEELILNKKKTITCLNCGSKDVKKMPTCFNSPGDSSGQCASGGCQNCHGCH